MNFEVGQKVKRTIIWDGDHKPDLYPGNVIEVTDEIITCEILVDGYRPMKYRATDGRAIKFFEGIKDEWIEHI